MIPSPALETPAMRRCPSCRRKMTTEEARREIETCPDLKKRHCARCCPWKGASPGAGFSIYVDPESLKGLTITARGGSPP